MSSPATPQQIETVVVCYTQATFDRLEARPTDPPDDEEAERTQAHYLANLAESLTTALQLAGCTAEVVRLPQRSFKPLDISRAAFAWRMMDLAESNGRPIDLALCLDFPAWSLQHPNKCVWLTSLPNFVMRWRVGRPPEGTSQLPINPDDPTTIRLVRDDDETERAKQVSGLLQAERRGIAEARRLLTANRAVAEEMARRGLQAQYNPLPTDLTLPPTDPQWQMAIKRLLLR